jgi:hypothetical protein
MPPLDPAWPLRDPGADAAPLVYPMAWHVRPARAGGSPSARSATRKPVRGRWSSQWGAAGLLASDRRSRASGGLVRPRHSWERQCRWLRGQDLDYVHFSWHRGWRLGSTVCDASKVHATRLGRSHGMRGGMLPAPVPLPWPPPRHNRAMCYLIRGIGPCSTISTLVGRCSCQSSAGGL